MKYKISLIVSIFIIAMFTKQNAIAQNNNSFIHIAKLVIDSSKLGDYKKALREHAETAVKVEPGVITLYAVYEKEHPTHVTVFEIYASEDAYKSHLKAPHFLKYKATVKD